MKKTDLKADIFCAKCKKKVLKTVTKLEGIDEVKVDIEKGTMTVVGTVDPVLVAKQLRNAGKYAEIINVEPNKKESKEDKEPSPKWCRQCELVGVSYLPYFDGPQQCSIL